MASSTAKPGYTHSDPFDSGFVSVDSIHQVYYQQYGKKDGKPVIFLHGGPGGQISKANTVYFDPAVYRVVLFDQRGAGKSTPNAELRENTTHHLVEDIETLRKRFSISKWHIVFGGSWGSTLALVYAQAYPDRVGSLVLRGIFMAREEELEWGTTSGACWSFPDTFEKYVTYLPEEDRADSFAGYYKLLTSENRETRVAAARAWNSWELSLSELRPSAASFEKLEDDNWSLAHAILECHYFVNGAWLEDGQILKKSNLDKIRHIPTTLIHGRCDIVCPPKAAYDLHKAWPESRLFFIPAAGHAASEPGIYEKLVEVCDEYASV